jgi:OmpA-OmpF porin, OOP family
MRLVILASTAALLAAASPAVAQTADTNSIIKMLTPQGSKVGGSVGDDGAVTDTNTRGIKRLAPSGTSASTAAAPAATHAAAAAPAAVKPSASLLVLFASGSSDLTNAGRAQLDQLGAALKDSKLSQSHFRVEGHTDTVGDDQSNLSLSERRAQAVVDYLVSQFGIDRAQLQAIGLGKEGLAIQTPDQTPEGKNRRVVIINLDG